MLPVLANDPSEERLDVHVETASYDTNASLMVNRMRCEISDAAGEVRLCGKKKMQMTS